MFGAAAMSISSFLVVTNALRINSFKPMEKKTLANKNIINEKVDCEMNVTIKIEGMMCPHCSGRVAKLLLECPAVKEADVSHERGDAVLNVDASADISALEKIIEDAGYKVVK
jgi:Cu2+-exporting ATPase